MEISNNKILITGGASGIGLGLTKRFIEENNTVIVCGRREFLLKELSQEYRGVITRKCDLLDPAEREHLYRWISDEHPDLNVLVNNAGIQQWMSVTDSDFYLKAREEININAEAPLHLSSLFINLKSLTTIINITSGLSFVPMARMPVYCASKAFFHSYTLSLRHLLHASGIEVIEVIPPALNTDLGGKGRHDNAPAVNEFIDAVFMQLRAGNLEISYGFSEAMAKAAPDELKKAFNRMNPV